MSDLQRRAQELLAHKRRALETRVPRLRRPAAQTPALPAPPAPPSAAKVVVLGSDEAELPLRLDERTRCEHMHVIGTTGGGKTNLIEHMARQDILNGRGVCVLDPHGGHPDSLYRRLVTWLGESGLSAKRRVHLIDPNAEAFATGFNPLAVPAGHDPAVVAEAALEAFQRLWGDEDPDSKPTIQRVLSGTFTALAELGLTLAEVRLLFDPEDIDGVREYVLGEVEDEYAREELLWLHSMGGDRAGIRDLRVEVTGPRNRLGKLVRLEALRTIVGQTERVIDLRRALDDGDIILANLAGGARSYEQGSDIVGRLLLRFLLFHAKRRHTPQVPYFVYLDECQRYLSGDVPNLLAEVRKYGIGLVLAHQWQSQLAAVDKEILSAVRSGTNIKVVFRVKDQVEAADLAEMVMPLNLEQPVEALIKETVVGHGRTWLRNGSVGATFGTSQASTRSHTNSVAETDSTGAAITVTDSVSRSRGTSRSRTVGESDTVTLTDSSSDTVGETVSNSDTHSSADTVGYTESESSGTSYNHATSRGGSNTRSSGWSSGGSSSRTASLTEPRRLGEVPIVTGRTEGTSEDSARSGSEADTDSYAESDSYGRSRQSSTARSRAHTEGDAHSHAVASSRSRTVGGSVAVSRGTNVADTVGESESTTHGRSVGVSANKGHAVTRGSSAGTAETAGTNQAVSFSVGCSEALLPILEKRAGSVHSKENVLYLAAQTLRSLKTGTALINYVDQDGMNSTMLRVPLRTMAALSDEAFAALGEAIAAKSPSAQPAAQAREVVHQRRLQLTKAAQQLRLPGPEPTEAREFRVANCNSTEGE